MHRARRIPIVVHNGDRVVVQRAVALHTEMLANVDSWEGHLPSRHYAIFFSLLPVIRGIRAKCDWTSINNGKENITSALRSRISASACPWQRQSQCARRCCKDCIFTNYFLNVRLSFSQQLRLAEPIELWEPSETQLETCWIFLPFSIIIWIRHSYCRTLFLNTNR